MIKGSPWLIANFDFPRIVASSVVCSAAVSCIITQSDDSFNLCSEHFTTLSQEYDINLTYVEQIPASVVVKSKTFEAELFNLFSPLVSFSPEVLAALTSFW